MTHLTLGATRPDLSLIKPGDSGEVGKAPGAAKSCVTHCPMSPWSMTRGRGLVVTSSGSRGVPTVRGRLP
jgi:hypothetical protein